MTVCSAEFLLPVLRSHHGRSVLEHRTSLKTRNKDPRPQFLNYCCQAFLILNLICDPCFLKTKSTEGFTWKHFIYFYIQPRSFVIIHKPRNDFLVDVTLKSVRCIHVPLWPISDEVLQQEQTKSSFYFNLRFPRLSIQSHRTWRKLDRNILSWRVVKTAHFYF